MKDLTLKELIASISSNRLSSKEVHGYFLNRIQKYDAKVQSFVYTNDFDETKEYNSKLEWVPIAIKDIFAEKGKKTSASSVILSDFETPYNATVIERLFSIHGEQIEYLVDHHEDLRQP